MNSFDIIIAGAGLAGTALTLELLNSPLRNNKILVVEQKQGVVPYDRTWSYWTVKKHQFSKAVQERYTSVTVASDEYRQTFNLRNAVLERISSQSLFFYAAKRIGAHKNVTVIHDRAESFYEDMDHAGVRLQKSGMFIAPWVFDSTSVNTTLPSNPFGVLGWTWTVRTKTNAFDTLAVTLFDFRNTPDSFSFFYILPVNRKTALLTLTQYGYQNEAQGDAKQFAMRYLKTAQNLPGATLENGSYGFIPFLNHHHDRNPSSHIVPIGVKAGLMNSLSSYAFTEIMADTERMVEAMAQHKRPYYPRHHTHFPGINRAMRRLIRQNPQVAKKMFIDLFKLNSNTDEVLSFLSQDKPFMEYFPLVRHMNPFPLLAAAI
ncbi:hypothetical protein HYS00_02075 [Candidatus Microgenomates bacterium]|nr:hypothetical protein [Candidatus Microgenomates bacterium]